MRCRQYVLRCVFVEAPQDVIEANSRFCQRGRFFAAAWIVCGRCVVVWWILRTLFDDSSTDSLSNRF